jgi:protein-tyrosine phosphatase
MIRVCFVCLGNICRSPTAEAVFRRLVNDAQLSEKLAIDSAGTGDYHVGQQADARARSAAKRRGYELSGRARQFVGQDFGRFDYVLAMDQDNLKALRRLSPNECAKGKIHLLRSFDATAEAGAEVPDPYYGGEDGFDNVIDICERACRGLLDQIARQ